MKLLFIISAMILGLSGAAWADEDTLSEATVASPSYDPTKEDCKCLQPKKADLPLHNEANDVRVVNWIVDPNATGTPPSYGATEASH